MKLEAPMEKVMFGDEPWEVVGCPFCGGPGKPFLSVPNTRFQHGPKEFKLEQCPECALVFLNPRPEKEPLGKYYEGGYYDFFVEQQANGALKSGGLWRSMQSVWRGMAKREFERKLREKVGRLEKHGPMKPGKVLDIGCASGEFLHVLKQRGWSAVGVEMSPTMADFARSNYGLDIRNGAIEDFEFQAGEFQAITLWSSLEHLRDPRGVLEKVHHIMAPGGLGIILVPNVASLEFRLFGTSWGHLDVPRHLTHFSPESLRRVIEKAGFTVLSIHHSTTLLRSTAEQAIEHSLAKLWNGGAGKGKPVPKLKVVLNSTARLVGVCAASPLDLAGVIGRAGHNITACFRK